MLTGVRHVIWDWNGTLLDDAWLCVDVMDGLLRRRGLPGLSPDRYAEIFRFPVRDYYRDLGFDLEGEAFEESGTAFIEGYDARQVETRLRAGAETTLRAVAASGRSQSVLSASHRPRLEAQARRLGVEALFLSLSGLDDHYAGSKVDLGRAHLASLGLPPDALLLVGDTDHDVEVARALGVRCVLVPSGHQSRRRLEGLGVPVLEGLEALAAPLAA